MKREYDISGMSCAACSARVEKVVGRIDGVESVHVNLANERMTVEIHPDAIEPMLAAIARAGFGAKEHQDQMTENNNSEKINNIRRRLILAACFALPLFYISMGPMIQLPLPQIIDPHSAPIAYALVQMVLAAVVMIIGRRFYSVGYSSLFRGSPNMDSLIAVGTTASFGYSVYSLVRIINGDAHAVHELYFESCGVIITLILLGKTLEAISKGKTSEAINRLMKLVPETATVLRDGEQIEIPTLSLVMGDILLLRPGSRIPADGMVVAGDSGVDESMLTGESLPVDKAEGDSVYAGSMNLNGMLQVRVSKVGGSTTLGAMIRMVEQAQGTKAPIARLADVVSGYFVPVVMILAFLSAALWKISGASWGFALSILVSVLVIACPCALGLATPTAIMVGIGKGAEYGILFKNGEAMEQLHRIQTIVFDKTGTITEGKPALTDWFAKKDPKELLKLVASAEQASEHPLAKAILQKAEDQQLTLIPSRNFENHAGYGISAIVNDQTVLVGNHRMMNEKGILFSEFEDALLSLSQEGKTPVLIAVDGKAEGVAAIADTIKADSASAVAKLQARGIQVVMLTGDDQKTAEAIAAKAGIQKIYAQVLPADKTAIIKKIQAEGKKVAMVGDGINDAPALATADVGIAIGSGTDIAMESADVVLMHGDLTSVPTAMELSRCTIRNIKQNLFWAFAYNSLGIPVAAGLLYLFGGPLLNPMIGAAAMSLSSVSVLSNALRLKRFGKEKKK
ncbi:MAG: cadmium-translocating P-type ATPase [Clostridia bacterium]|nr:cadmium-translocating P-type ATPase [Clostridia bacterium]